MALVEFDDIATMQAFVGILKPFMDTDLGRFLIDDGNGNWIPSTDPGIYLGYPNNPTPEYPRLILTYQGSNDNEGFLIDKGWATVEDPDNPPATLDVPYFSKYLNYVITITAESGTIDGVYQGQRKSSEYLLSKIRKRFMSEVFRRSINDDMNSSVTQIIPTVPNTTLDNTTFHDTSSMTIVFSTVDTYFDLENQVFDTVQHDSILYHISDEDPSPIVTGTRSVPFQ